MPSKITDTKPDIKQDGKPEQPKAVTSNWLENTLNEINSLPAQCEPMRAVLAGLALKINGLDK